MFAFRWRRSARHLPPDQNAILAPDLLEKFDQLEKIMAHMRAIEEHRWELQHRINQLRDDVVKLQQQDPAGIAKTVRADIEAFRVELRDLYESAYGRLGRLFRRRVARGTEDTLIDRFGHDERARRGH